MKTAKPLLPNSWTTQIGTEFQQPYLQTLLGFIAAEAANGKVILPPEMQRFNALNATPFDKVKVVILGQDPYPTPGHAHGLCFSVLPDVQPLPKSLININKELLSDCGVQNEHTGYLQPWADQGVLLLNAVLSVEAGKANSHQNQGWETFTDAIIRQLNQHKDHLVFILWGNYAQKKGAMIDRQRHFIIESPHPSPLSAYRGFYGSRPFSKTNHYLTSQGLTPIDWQLPR